MTIRNTLTRPPEMGKPLIRLESVDSTNIYAMNLLKTDDPVEGTVILAGYQTGGKGQSGNSWYSNKGENLLFSLILKPVFLPAEKQFYLSMSVSNAICMTIEHISDGALVKWPNDILLKGKKVGGILIENMIMKDYIHASVTGIGLNVNQLTFPDDLADAVSIGMVTGTTYDLDQLFYTIMGNMRKALEPLYCGNLAEIRTAYLNRLYRLNQWARYRDDNGTFEGRINDVADTGELIVEKPDGSGRNYAFKEIQFQ